SLTKRRTRSFDLPRPATNPEGLVNSVVVIPARFGSTRFPGKPLAQVAGISMLQRVWALAVSVPEANRVVVATDHADIEALCRSIAADVVRTIGDYRSGTDR